MAAKKLGKKIEGTEVIFTMDEVEHRYNTALLPADLTTRLVAFGVSHKLGDSAASSKTSDEAKKNIDRVWEGLMEGKWSTRVPGEEKEKTPKISQKTILANLANLPPEQQETARVLLASLGIIPA